MVGCLKGCLGKVVGLALLVGAGVAVVLWGPELEPRVRAWLGEEVVEEGPTPELAEATLDRFEVLRSGEGPDRLSLGDRELSSVIRYSLPGILPPGVDEPSVELRDGKVHLRARVALGAFPELPSLDDVIGVLPDTVEIRMRGSLLPFDQERAALHVDGVQAMRVPLPDRFIPEILAALGRQDRPGLPPDAMMIPLPQGLESAYVLRDSLVLVADR
ncbi:MAG: hypothetical protein PVI57_13590 [Gemmatimonadota bacterium]|jgi:hypothetical protein